MTSPLPNIIELSRRTSPARAPQALAWREDVLWVSSRDDRRIYGIAPNDWTVLADTDAPGIPWGGVAADGFLYYVMGEGADDDRYLRRLSPDRGFDQDFRVPLPELTGSYLSCADGAFYVSQWYKHRVLQLRPDGEIQRIIEIGAEICGHAIVGAEMYVLRGTEKEGESWRVARLKFAEKEPQITDLATVPFACRSLAHDGNHFWTNHRAQNETVSFDLP